MSDPLLWTLPLAILGGAIRVSTPFLFVSLGECLTEKSGRVNLGLEGTLVLGAITAYAVACHSGQALAGVVAAALAGCAFGMLHGWLCGLRQVNDIAIGIALMILGMGLAFYFGKAYIQPVAPRLPSIDLGWWSDIPQLRAALRINTLFLAGAALALAMSWMLRNTRIGLTVRVVGDSGNAARALSINPWRVRFWCTAAGGALAGIGGAYLSLYYPGSWNEGISSGQGMMAVALVIFARWKPLNCFWTALLFGGAGALGPALQSMGINGAYHLFYTAPYALSLGILIATSSPEHADSDAPGELGITR
jgi:ABC-type uncharacterized transport system permease subunit